MSQAQKPEDAKHAQSLLQLMASKWTTSVIFVLRHGALGASAGGLLGALPHGADSSGE